MGAPKKKKGSGFVKRTLDTVFGWIGKGKKKEDKKTTPSPTPPTPFRREAKKPDLQRIEQELDKLDKSDKLDSDKSDKLDKLDKLDSDKSDKSDKLDLGGLDKSDKLDVEPIGEVVELEVPKVYMDKPKSRLRKDEIKERNLSLTLDINDPRGTPIKSQYGHSAKLVKSYYKSLGGNPSASEVWKKIEEVGVKNISRSTVFAAYKSLYG